MASPAQEMRNAGTLFEISENRNKRNEYGFYGFFANNPCTYSTNARDLTLASLPVGNTPTGSQNILQNNQCCVTTFRRLLKVSLELL
jgi:hypothetical protein